MTLWKPTLSLKCKHFLNGQFEGDIIFCHLNPCEQNELSMIENPKVHGANMGPTWVLSAPDGPVVGPMNLAIRVSICNNRGCLWENCEKKTCFGWIVFFVRTVCINIASPREIYIICSYFQPQAFNINYCKPVLKAIIEHNLHHKFWWPDINYKHCSSIRLREVMAPLK